VHEDGEFDIAMKFPVNDNGNFNPETLLQPVDSITTTRGKAEGTALPLVCPWVEFVVPAGVFA